MVGGQRSQDHAAAGESAPEHQQPHGSEVGGDAPFLQDAHHPFLWHHGTDLLKGQAFDHPAGVLPHFDHAFVPLPPQGLLQQCGSVLLHLDILKIVGHLITDRTAVAVNAPVGTPAVNIHSVVLG